MLMLKIIISVTTLLSMAFLAISLNVTTPVTAGPFGILVIFIFAYLSSLGVVTYFIYFVNRVIARVSIMLVTQKPYPSLTFKRSYYFSTIIAAAPIMMIGLQSVGATGLYESMLVLIFVLIGCLYISKRVS